MASATCVINGQKGRGGTTYETKSQYMGYGGSSPTYYDYTLSFTTGDFNGASTSITLNIQMGNTNQGNSRTYRWALLTSDANVMGSTNNLYRNTAKAVTDENQIAQGTITWNDVNKETHKVLTIETTELKPNTNYFLVLWAYSTSPTSMLTVSATQYHGDILVEYDPIFTVELNHCLMDSAGGMTWYSRTNHEVDAGASFTPVLIAPPSTHTQEGATFDAWLADRSENVGGGIVGEDYITVNADLTVEVYYFPAGSFIIYNDKGTAAKCEVYIKDGTAVRIDVYYNDKGTAVKI